MTYSPSAYAIENSGSWHIVLICPSGLKAMLRMTYKTKANAEGGIFALGFRQIDPPKADDTP